MKHTIISEQKGDRLSEYAARHAIVRFLKPVSDDLATHLDALGYSIGEQIIPGTRIVSWTASEPEREYKHRIRKLEEMDAVGLVEPDYVVSARQTPDNRETDWIYDIDIPYISGNNIRADGVLIGLLDTGINPDHEDLEGILFPNPHESRDGMDSDGNGYIDDLLGYDFVDLDNDPLDEDGHGTALAGAIAANRGNGKGIDGIAAGAQILNVRILDEAGQGFITDAIRGIHYAKSFGVDILNCSWGTYDRSETLKAALDDFAAEGGIIVTAAGNEGYEQDDESEFLYPACYDVEGLISVGSYGPDGGLSEFSNWDKDQVDWLLPGESILLPGLQNSQYMVVSGTSVSAAVMSGYLALVSGKHADADRSKLLSIIKQASSPHLPFFSGRPKVGNYGRVSIRRVIEEDYLTAPDLQLGISPDSYLYGEVVELSISGLENHLGSILWYVDSTESPITDESLSISVETIHGIEDVKYVFRFSTYYVPDTEIEVQLSPKVKDLDLTDSFRSEYRVATSERLDIEAAVTGSGPISVKWFSEDGEFLTEGRTLRLSPFTLFDRKSVYFTAENSVSQIQSPEIQVNPAEFNLSEHPFDGGHLIEFVAGNNRYFGITETGNWISGDAINWTRVDDILTERIISATFHKGKFFGIRGRTVVTSEYGHTWDETDSPALSDPYNQPLVSIRSEGDYLVASTEFNGETWISTNGHSWEPTLTVRHAGGLYFRVNQARVETSPDFIIWSPTGMTTNGETPYFYVGYANGVYLLHGGLATYTSTDGASWIEADNHADRVDTLFFHEGLYYYGEPSSLTVFEDVESPTTLSADVWPWERGFLTKLDDGRIFAHLNYIEGAINFVDTTLAAESSPPVKWILLSGTDLVLGDALKFRFDVDPATVRSLSLYYDGFLAEQRTEEPFFEDWYLDAVGELTLSAVMELSDGTTLYSDLLPVSVAIPQESFRIPENNFCMVGNGGEIGVAYKRTVDGQDTIAYIPNLRTADPEILLDNPVNTYPDPDYTFFRTNAGEALAVLVYPRDWNTSRNRFYRIEPGQTPYLLADLDVSTDIGSFWYEYWDPELIMSYNDYSQGQVVVSRWNGDSLSPLLNYPVVDQLYRATDGTWDSQPFEQASYTKVRNHLLAHTGISLAKAQVTDLSTGREWSLPSSFTPHYLSGDALIGSLGERQRPVLHDLAGRTSPFDLGENIEIREFEDRQDFYFAGLREFPFDVVLYPRNEIVLMNIEEPPSVITSHDGLRLKIHGKFKQLSLGPTAEKTVTFDIYLEKSINPSPQTAAHVAEVRTTLNLQRGNWRQIQLEVPFPDDIDPGTYSVGLAANLDQQDFPERTHNNIIWYEWTRENGAALSIIQNPQTGNITVSSPAAELEFGDTIELTFDPLPGYTFSGWGGDLTGIDNPASRIMPNFLEISAGTLPDALALLFPDAHYSGVGDWHRSRVFGWFDSESYPWIHHLNHGWLYMNTSGEASPGYVYDFKMGWLYIPPSAYPNLYQFDNARWLYYLQDSGNPRWFYDLNASEWISIE